MIESELFGHKKGAFTDAVIDKPGLMEEADGGTFFCDEIADISPNLQAKFLSVLEDRELRRLGENRTREIDVRFILATNRNLYKLVEKGKFRKDLFYRISVLSFQISPLRERKGDIPLLIDFLIERESKRKSEDFMLSQEAFGKLLRHSFPGNVRELENILEGAIVFTDNSVIEEKDILFTKVTCETEVKYRSRYSFDKILDTMVKHQGNKTKAAQELGISRMHFYRLLDELRK
jgi:transcriptional regulator with PAS, ATPase and Fis domain